MENTPLNEQSEVKSPEVQENVLTDNEKKQLEEYKGENSFIKSLSDGYKEHGRLSEKQLNAFRKFNEDEVEKLIRCPHTDLELKQKCRFTDKKFEDLCNVIVNSIRPKALCLSDIDNNRYAWMPSKAVNAETIIDTDSGYDIMELTLKEWFTRDDGFWKESKPFVKKEKPEEKSNTEDVKDDFDKQVEEMYKEPDTDDGLPF